ncbi:nucleolar protein dao-5-like [Mytilus californianus]|uniref:nucleolar protein dao-5-like n=1 Tax=Mytilus californianus TaxID=6549 RepID=UPI002246D088|nr:nucleolar protein dao-5-like [Mytilus californianus]
MSKMSCKCVDNTDILLQILEELKKHTKYHEERESIQEEKSPAKKNPSRQKRSPTLTLSQRAQELYIKYRVSKEEIEEGGGDAVHEHYLKKWKSLSEEKKNKWKKKAEKVAIDVGKTSVKTTLRKKPTKVSAFQVFTSQNLHKLKGKLPNTDAMRQNGEDWKNLSEQEKQKYIDDAQKITKQKFEEYESYLQSLPEDEREIYKLNVIRQENERKEKIAQRKKEAGKKQSEIKQYLNVTGASSRPGKSKNKLRAVKSDPGEEDDDDEELSDKYEFLSTSTPIHISKLSDKLQPASKLKEKVKSTIENSKIITPKKKLKRPLESNEECGKNTPHPKKKKVAPSPVKKVEKDSSSSESDSEEATTKTKKSSLATIKQFDKKSKKPEKKMEDSSSSSESDSEEATIKTKKTPLATVNQSDKKSKKPEIKTEDSSSSSESDSEDTGTTIKSNKSNVAEVKKLSKNMKKQDRKAKELSSISESDSEKTISKQKKSNVKKVTAAEKRKDSDSPSSSESESTAKTQVKKSSPKKASPEKTSPKKTSPKKAAPSKKTGKGKQNKSSSSSSSSESDSDEEKGTKSSVKKNPLATSVTPSSPMQQKNKKMIFRANPYTKEMLNSDSDSESQTEKTGKTTSPKKSKFQALNSKSKSSTSSSSDDSD